jgi:hypothetical protein
VAAKKTKKTDALKFDVEKANAMLNDLGGLVVTDPCYAELDWAGISLVVDFDGDDVSLSGYVYDAKGKHASAVPENGEVFDVVEALRDTMATDGQGAWVSALVRITQPGPEIEMEFDYEGGQWEVDAAALRPESVPAPKAAVKKPAAKKKPVAKKPAAKKPARKSKR